MAVDFIEPGAGHRFNDDLLMNPSDLERAQTLFPHVAHLLDHPALRHAFRKFDLPANTAKRRSRVAGLIAIGMGAISLVIAAATPAYRTSSKIWVLGLVAAVFGVASILIGLFGVLYAGSKRKWLYNRLLTERLRQFHFQCFVCRWPDIAASMNGKEAAKEFTDQRKTWFDTFLARLPAHVGSELTEILDDESQSKCWLHPLPQAPTPATANVDLQPLFKAYRELRIMHQLHYANYKLRNDGSIFSWSTQLQDAIFSYTTLICILTILTIHLWIAFSVLLDGHFLWLEPYLFAFESGNAGIDVHVWVIWIAIAALAIRALQEGLQPEREIERYRHYRASIRAIRDRFDQASSPAAKYDIMLEMERLAFDELRNFLHSSYEARFVM
jgi:hypothetical protein